ncbi:DUF4834 domain-containing protein [Winogradskyella sp. PC-19]|uniref:DUF4834 family protein n=1 Tax=unclassified Winogradskyella TaxID=2615021 RepID=UPI000B3C43E1|nr:MULTISPECIES: DUF4834 family protein [unclassified Winogradskyella]ARV08476.1 DUF4834 domain-containing protein [Winogradskyella sp. PC-19]
MIYTLSVVGVARTLIWIIAIYFIVKILSRLFAPFLMKYAAKKMEQRFGEQFNTQQQSQKPKQKEGETVIDKMPSNSNSSNKKVGEYIDYEEID